MPPGRSNTVVVAPAEPDSTISQSVFMPQTLGTPRDARMRYSPQSALALGRAARLSFGRVRPGRCAADPTSRTRRGVVLRGRSGARPADAALPAPDGHRPAPGGPARHRR